MKARRALVCPEDREAKVEAVLNEVRPDARGRFDVGCRLEDGFGYYQAYQKGSLPGLPQWLLRGYLQLNCRVIRTTTRVTLGITTRLSIGDARSLTSRSTWLS